jgi:hypothetical protein
MARRARGVDLLPPISSVKYEYLKRQLSDLADMFGRNRILSIVKRRPKPNRRGRPQEWDYIQLFTVWYIVRYFLEGTTLGIRDICRRIARKGGLYGLSFHEEQSTHSVKTQERLRRLYYEAEDAFANYEKQYKSLIEQSRSKTQAPLKSRLEIYLEDDLSCLSHYRWKDHIIILTITALEHVKSELCADGVLPPEARPFFQKAILVEPPVGGKPASANPL